MAFYPLSGLSSEKYELILFFEMKFFELLWLTITFFYLLFFVFSLDVTFLFFFFVFGLICFKSRESNYLAML